MHIYDGILRRDIVVPTVEHGFQADKTLSAVQHEMILDARSPSIAKRLGRSCVLRPDWESIKIERMRAWILLKFLDPQLRSMLTATGSSELVEGNTWRDEFWGVCRGVGKNWLGKLLMERRSNL